MNESIKSILSDEIISEIETAEQQNKDNHEAIYSLYIHIVPKEISGYDWDKYYVGITKQNPFNRWRNGKGYRDNIYFNRAIKKCILRSLADIDAFWSVRFAPQNRLFESAECKKYGWENITHIIVTNSLLSQQVFDHEKRIIALFKSNDNKYGYNITSGGEGCLGLKGDKNPLYGKPRPKEVVEKMIKSRLENPVKRTEKQRKVASDYLKELWKNPDYRTYMTGPNSPSRNFGEKNHMYGKTGSKCKNSHKIVCLNTLEVFISARIVSDMKNLNYGVLCACCKGNRKSCGKDENGNPLRWQYYDLYLQENNLTDEEARKRLIFVLDEY